MLIRFDLMEDTVLSNFYGGDGELIARMFRDGQNKILKGRLAPGSNIGLHPTKPPRRSFLFFRERET